MADVIERETKPKFTGRINDKTPEPIRLKNYGIDVIKNENGEEEIVIQGFLDIEGVKLLQVGPYQREILAPITKGGRTNSIEKAVRNGKRLQAIVCGMRGEDTRVSGNEILLKNDVFVIDGLQRISGMKAVASQDEALAETMRIGAEVRLNTTQKSEAELFHILNTQRTPMSPNVIFRNKKETNPAIGTLFGLSGSDKTFALYGRVSWKQRMTREELVSALTLVKVAQALHRHVEIEFARGVGKGNEAMASAVERMAQAVGLRVFRENVHTFFEVIEDCWGVRNVAYTTVNTQLRSNFLMTVARLFSEHTNFWEGDRLVVPTIMRKSMASFPIRDPEIARMAAAGNMTLPLLMGYLIKHIEKGKRVNKLVQRTSKSSTAAHTDAEEIGGQ